jgi:protocatechuate 3,4-dioxygenase beta subunit
MNRSRRRILGLSLAMGGAAMGGVMAPAFAQALKRTPKPGAYPATSMWTRPPHIHFEVTGKAERLTTQMYFPGEPLNDKDLLLLGVRYNRDGVIARIAPPTAGLEKDSLLATWDIVLGKG